LYIFERYIYFKYILFDELYVFLNVLLTQFFYISNKTPEWSIHLWRCIRSGVWYNYCAAL